MTNDFASNFKEHSVAEFFKKNKQMLGLSGKIRSLTTIIHEFVTNSIDACEEAGILPDIDVKITEIEPEYYEVHIVDNGPGIPDDKIGKAIGKLLAGTKFHRQIQLRGQQGIGASGCVLFSQMTTGQPTIVISGHKDNPPTYMELSIDTAKNEPKIHTSKKLDIEFKGLAIKSKFKDVIYKDNAQSPLEYLKRLAIANPHVNIRFLDPFGKKYEFLRSSEKLPKHPIEMKPHIKSITVDSFLQNAKSSEYKVLSAYMKNFYDRTGDKVLDDLQKLIDFDIKEFKIRNLDWATSERIVKAIQKVKTIAPRTDALIPIEEELLTKSVVKILKPESFSVITRKPAVYKGGYPFQIEVAIAYGGESGRTLKDIDETQKFEIMRFANRAPLLFDNGSCAITKAVQSIDWKRYSIKDLENMALTIFVNISSVHIPYTSAGKQAIADDDEIIEEIRQALMQAARTISLHISRKKSLADKEERKKIFYKYGTEVADSLAHITGKSRKDIEEKLHDIITKRLAIEEVQEKLNKEKDAITFNDNNAEIKDETNKEIKEKPKTKKTLMDYVDNDDE